MPRPRAVTYLAFAVFLLSAFNLWRAARLLSNTGYLSGLALSVSPLYLGGSSLFWALALSAAAVGLWRLRRWGRWLTLGAIALYHAHGWLNRLLFDASGYARQVWPWEAVVSVVSLGVVWGVLWQPGVRRAFEKRVR